MNGTGKSIFPSQPENERYQIMLPINLIYAMISNSILPLYCQEYQQAKTHGALLDGSNETVSSRFLITAIGILSAPVMPN